jgi:hypothetical protein
MAAGRAGRGVAIQRSHGSWVWGALRARWRVRSSLDRPKCRCIFSDDGNATTNDTNPSNPCMTWTRRSFVRAYLSASMLLLIFAAPLLSLRPCSPSKAIETAARYVRDQLLCAQVLPDRCWAVVGKKENGHYTTP